MSQSENQRPITGTSDDDGWIVINYANQPPVFECEHCGETEQLLLPVTITDMTKASDDFTAQHRGCK